MITKNLGRSYSGCGKYDYGKIPRPYTGDTESGKVTSYNQNIWRYGNSNSFYQHGFLNGCGFNSFSAGSGGMTSYGFKRDRCDGNGYFMLDVGFGNTAESADDYKLAESNMQLVQRSTAPLYHVTGKIYTGQGSNVQNLMPDSDDGCMLRIEALYQNESPTDDVVVKEMGVIANPSGNGSTSSVSCGEAGWFLIARKVLASPVTIHPGETYKFTYKIKAF